ncbi:unnamed protein product [Parnassius apollo]|uniref:(apollo) hypothetical protein n=1 Tax=Parnassius apollo TaxID=110799 RepID=A0A8S3XEQ6_PARAO|nr:unnamed protein product [Parnassius apollo]
MVKFGKNKFKALNKLTKNRNVAPNNVTNKILKKKLNVEKKVTFQKEVLLKETVKNDTLVHNIKKTELLLNNLSKKRDEKKVTIQEPVNKTKKLKPVEKHRKRQQTQLNDTKLLLKLMKKK